ncbi:MAG: [acyl-carrier-protein] S-malonyltransferase [Candidatus Cloacimonetes bacterium HGW-Cloacimonetes-3]|jgi:[acyl-carrier-protein] S-malonyltransferase|nr:MAG: [acyl-carrier-protein] S-malonyltransferase [Candidatus Cloacimonetes bacterium HGW-Cloacimonetes-3]
MKTAFVFPGQGAQYIGMSLDFIQSDPHNLEVMDAFDKTHATNLKQVMLEGPEENLKQTSFTQPAILFHSIAALHRFQAHCKVKADFVAGHSLGEFSALVASGMLSFSDAMHLVHKRGEYMIKANAGVPFAMSAIIGLDAQVVIDICAEASSEGLVQAVNFNTPIQTVISGTAEGVAAAGELAKSKGAKRVLPLVVGGPFHTPLIAQASLWLYDEMKTLTFHDGNIPVVSNYDALPCVSGTLEREKLAKQIISPVRWVECIEYMVTQGVQQFIEFGPQKVLSGMIKNINKDCQVFSIDKIEDVDAVVSAIG